MFSPLRLIQRVVGGQKMPFTYLPGVEDDLEAVVKSVYHAIRVEKVHVALHSCTEPEHMLAFWKNELSPPVWKALMESAYHRNYDKLKEQIQALMA